VHRAAQPGVEAAHVAMLPEGRVRTKSSRDRVSARSALVRSVSDARTRNRWLSVRASSASTKLSNPSDLPPATLNRGRAARTWLGCSAITTSPASSSRSINSPSGRSIAPNGPGDA